MKKITVLFSVICSFFVVLTFLKDGFAGQKENIKDDKEIKAVYISYIEFNSYVSGKDEETSKKNITKMLDDIKDFGFNTVIVHVRAFSDSIYKSDYYPVSNTVLNNKNTYPNYDVLEFFIKEAHEKSLKFEAWINPFRISNQTSLDNVSIDSPYYKFIKNKDAAVIEGKGVYLNPASSEVRELIVKGIEEIVKNYDVDGIHFDDYFYPDKKIDLHSYEKYKKDGGILSLEEYRLENITTLIRNVYEMIKVTKENVKFGIAPEGNIQNDYENSYLDVKKILASKGYVDYIMPQIYFGFENQTRPFKETLDEWNNMIKDESIKIIPALAFYKIGTTDKYALSGKNEWIENSDIIKRQILYSRSASNYNGFSLFRYDYIFNENKHNDNTKKEIIFVKEIINND